eukprot:CAMPEP_0115829046 /NCGR_PEP_ID=MMETSP0287-20121206/894_1 /TAXON_ID=412157 /ORGANISM="Chrysochromulina rotalis, Strain UIO044" /LENGTH=63 /DNA_ID=CAMNT_0003282295 /DNA_START=34 /DNA_END=225 /DNA_ORIENTATION=+
MTTSRAPHNFHVRPTPNRVWRDRAGMLSDLMCTTTKSKTLNTQPHALGGRKPCGDHTVAVAAV